MSDVDMQDVTNEISATLRSALERGGDIDHAMRHLIEDKLRERLSEIAERLRAKAESIHTPGAQAAALEMLADLIEGVE